MQSILRVASLSLLALALASTPAVSAPAKAQKCESYQFMTKKTATQVTVTSCGGTVLATFEHGGDIRVQRLEPSNGEGWGVGMRAPRFNPQRARWEVRAKSLLPMGNVATEHLCLDESGGSALIVHCDAPRGQNSAGQLKTCR